MESIFYRSKEGILLCTWKDKKARKPVMAVSTYSTKGQSEIANRHGAITTKRCIVNEYNYSMNGCDRMHQMISYYNIFNQKTIKWWKRLFMWCLEVSQINSYILFCLTWDAGTKAIPLIKFKRMLIKELLTEADNIIPPDHKTHLVRKPSVTVTNKPQLAAHLVTSHDADRNCVVCSTPQDRERTKFMCNTCDAYLHPRECFQTFHMKKNSYIVYFNFVFI